MDQHKNECGCQKATCGCASTAAKGCTCGSDCGCKSSCNCANGCRCAAK